MEHYHSNGPCPKCGCTNASTKHRAAFGIEHIARGCPRCGYQWIEKPLDAVEAKPEQQPTGQS